MDKIHLIKKKEKEGVSHILTFFSSIATFAMPGM
jgi:hypothetical protein